MVSWKKKKKKNHQKEHPYPLPQILDPPFPPPAIIPILTQKKILSLPLPPLPKPPDLPPYPFQLPRNLRLSRPQDLSMLAPHSRKSFVQLFVPGVEDKDLEAESRRGDEEVC